MSFGELVNGFNRQGDETSLSFFRIELLEEGEEGRSVKVNAWRELASDQLSELLGCELSQAGDCPV